jgi:leucine dehydrogenase
VIVISSVHFCSHFVRLSLAISRRKRVEIFETLHQLGYGDLHFGYDAATGLRALVAIHASKLGPAIGGSRIRHYDSEADAVDDVTRLAQGMAYKAAVAHLAHGGGKAVIMAPPDLARWPVERRAELFRAFGRFVDSLNGRYVTTEDSGTSPADMDHVREATKHVLGTSIERGGSGDPSPFTALGCRRGIEAIAQHLLGRSDLKGLHVAVQGVGHVGAHLARELQQAGARLTICDVDPARRQALAAELGATVVDVSAILEVECDIVSPCALGGALTEDVVPRLKCKVIAGAANNQLRTPGVGKALAARGIFYAPDYVINGGGLINVAEEFAGYDAASARKKVLAIYDTIAGIVERSRREKVQPEIIADRMAQEIIAAGPKPRA